MSRRGGKPLWAYVYGAGQLQAEGVKLAGVPDVRAPLSQVVRDPKNSRYAFETRAALPGPDTLKGVWLRVIHGDGTAHGYRIDDLETIPGGARIAIHDDPGFALTDLGMRMLFFPCYEIPGPPYVEIRVPTFAQL